MHAKFNKQLSVYYVVAFSMDTLMPFTKIMLSFLSFSLP